VRYYQIVKSGIMNAASSVGMYLQFADDFQKFKKFLAPVIKSFHQVNNLIQPHTMEKEHEDLQQWISKNYESLSKSDKLLIDKDGDLDLARADKQGEKVDVNFKKLKGTASMRVRTGRNLARPSKRFPAQMTKQERVSMAIGSVAAAAAMWDEEFKEECKFIKPQDAEWDSVKDKQVKSKCTLLVLTPSDTIVTHDQFGRKLAVEESLFEWLASNGNPNSGGDSVAKYIDKVTFVERERGSQDKTKKPWESFTWFQEEGGYIFEDQIEDEYIRAGNIGKDYPIGRGSFDVPNLVRLYFGEEDDLRIQAVATGTKIQKVFSEFITFVNTVETHYKAAMNLEFAFFKDDAGNKAYLNSCPSNAGSGMRASVQANLNHLLVGVGQSEEELNKITDQKKLHEAMAAKKKAQNDAIDKVFADFNQQNGLTGADVLPLHQIRGSTGEHQPINAEAKADISPQHRYGVSEVEIAKRIYKLARVVLKANSDRGKALAATAAAKAPSKNLRGNTEPKVPVKPHKPVEKAPQDTPGLQPAAKK